MTEIDYTAQTQMMRPFPEIRKLGVVSPNGESSPFVWRGTAMRLELEDSNCGVDPNADSHAVIRVRDSGEIIARFGSGCYYYSLFTENDTAYVLGTVSEPTRLCGSEIRIFESRDLRHWESRSLFRNPGWEYYNTSLTRSPDGYVLLLEAGAPREYVGEHPFTLFFAHSPDLYHWTAPDPTQGFSKDRYMGGPFLRYSRGWYYLFSVTELPCRRYTNYVYRSQDLQTWYVSPYSPILMPGNDDRKIAPHAADLTPEKLKQIETGFISSDSDVDLCEWEGKTLMNYNAGNQLGFYVTAEAVCDLPPDRFLESLF